MNNLQTLKGFRDFLPQEKRKRDWVLRKIVESFERFGFEPLETPALEYESLLLGKYGTEADKLVYQFTDRGGRKIALRYDQTVPTARVLAQYKEQLPRYFRRYQIQNVFRAEKPQKGRFRQFLQCDIDIFGSTSPLADAEILACSYAAYAAIGYPTITLKINDRQTLVNTLKPYATKALDVFSIIQSVDKLEKIGAESVVSELQNKRVSPEAATAVLDAIKQSHPSDNLNAIIQAATTLGVAKDAIVFDPTLARGLDYYTGMIFEVFVPEYAVGSLGGGGRYDDLITELSGTDVPAVGIAFGFDRMVTAADELSLIPQSGAAAVVLVTIFDEKTKNASLQVTAYLRQNGIATELFPTPEKIDKQLKYANRTGIPYVVIIGPHEAKQNKIQLKELKTGKQEALTQNEVVEKMSA